MTAPSMVEHDADGFVHAAGFYASDEEFVSTFAPFCLQGLEAGEPTVVRVSAHNTDLLKSALDDPEDLWFLTQNGQYPSPPAALQSVLDLLATHAPAPGRRLRLLGELPAFDGLKADAWLRYEAAANHVLAAYPIDGLCSFDARTVPDEVQDELRRTHHVVVDSGGVTLPNPGFEPPAAFVAGRSQPQRDPLEERPPVLDLTDPTPADARHALGVVARDMALDATAADALLLGASEVVTNAMRHGGPPVQVRAWARPGRVVVAVRDEGAGPEDPFAGLVPVQPGMREGGLGLWITHLVCPETALSIDDAGFTVRLAVGE